MEEFESFRLSFQILFGFFGEMVRTRVELVGSGLCGCLAANQANGIGRILLVKKQRILKIGSKLVSGFSSS